MWYLFANQKVFYKFHAIRAIDVFFYVIFSLEAQQPD